MPQANVTHVTPYLTFNGRCEEAVDFYKQALGAEVETMMRFGDAPTGSEAPRMPDAMKSKIMHASFKVGGTAIMASDGMCTGTNQPSFHGVAISLTVADIATAERLFEAVGAGGTVEQPLIETFFAPRFGMVADKFGLRWMVVVES